VTIGLEDWVEDVGFMPNLCVHTSCEACMPSSSIMSDFGHVCNSCDWTQSFDKLKRAFTSILVMCFLMNTLRVANGFHFL